MTAENTATAPLPIQLPGCAVPCHEWRGSAAPVRDDDEPNMKAGDILRFATGQQLLHVATGEVEYRGSVVPVEDIAAEYATVRGDGPWDVRLYHLPEADIGPVTVLSVWVPAEKIWSVAVWITGPAADLMLRGARTAADHARLAGIQAYCQALPTEPIERY